MTEEESARERATVIDAEPVREERAVEAARKVDPKPK
jgi:hypothetical protein